MSPYTQGPPPPPGPPGPGQGPLPGQQPWLPYPGQQPGPGMPMAPPPRRGHGLLWTVVGLVVALAAAGVTYLLVQDSGGDGSGGDGGGGNGGSAQGGTDCTGDYCVGGYAYVNACAVFDPAAVASRLGAPGARMLVQETYADPLPKVDDPARAAWTYGLTSSCAITPEDRDAASFHSVAVQLKQTAKEAQEPSAKGRPLAGAEGAVVEELDGRARVNWRYRNVSAVLDVTWSNRNPAIPDPTIAELVETITKGLDDPPSEPTELGELAEDGKRVITDACTVFTGADFQSATRYVVNPTNVHRTYSTTLEAPISTTCRRFTAPSNGGLPEPEGTTFLDGAMVPTVTVAKYQDAAAAAAQLGENRELIAEAVAVPGIGGGAVFGIGSSSHFTLQFTSGFHLVEVDCGLSNGNADWTPEDMRTRLQPMAEAIAARMG